MDQWNSIPDDDLHDIFSSLENDLGVEHDFNAPPVITPFNNVAQDCRYLTMQIAEIFKDKCFDPTEACVDYLKELVKDSENSVLIESNVLLEYRKTLYKILTHVDASVKEISSILSTNFLAFQEVNRIRAIQQDIKSSSSILLYLLDQVDALANFGVTGIVPFHVVLTHEPYYQVLFKDKSSTDTFGIRVVSLFDVEYSRAGYITIQLSSEENLVAKKLKNDCVRLDSRNCAIAEKIICQTPTRMNMSKFMFIYNGDRYKSKPAVSNPVIVITNESQWLAAVEKLILHLSFANNQESIPWIKFMNELQLHFERASRNGVPSEITHREITKTEFDWFHTKWFGSRSIVTRAEVSEFWKWFGCACCAIRFKRHIATMWATGSIAGFLPRSQSEHILSSPDFKSGSFIIRFSEHYVNSFAITYKLNNEMANYLVKPDDTGSQKTLPDFLRYKLVLDWLVRYDKATGKWKSVSKEEGLGQFYSKSQPLSGVAHGYVLTL